MNRQKDDPSEDSNFRALTTTVMFNDFEKLESMIKSAQFSRYIKLIRFSINLDGKENRSKNHSFLPSDNLSLMHVAAFYDALECFIILSQNGFQVDCQSADSLHPIQYACYSDAVEIVSYILQVKPSEATFNFSDKYPQTVTEYSPIQKTIFIRNVPQLVAFLNVLKSDDQNASSSDSYIITAVKNHEFTAIPLLVKAGYDTGYVNKAGECALQLACFYNDRIDKEDSKYELIKYLLDNTTNIEPRVSNTQGPAQWICKSKSPDIARLFFEKKGDQIDVHRVDQLGYLGPSYLSFFKSNQSDIIDILKIFRQHGFDFNYYNIQTNTPSILESFILAIDKLHNVIKWLLENGANPNVPFVRGNGQFSTLLEKALATYSISHHFKSYQSNK